MLDVNIQRVFGSDFTFLVVRQQLLDHVCEDVHVSAAIELNRFGKRLVVRSQVIQVDCDVDLLAVCQVNQLGRVFEDLVAVIVGCAELGEEILDRF